LQNKVLTISRLLEDRGDREQIFYEEFMEALGYKQNKIPFRALAKTIPLSLLRNSRDHSLAILLGAAGLLPQPDMVTEPFVARYIRTLWDIWWKSGLQELDKSIEWTLHGLRPNNHPTRRIAAAAALFSGEPNLLQQIDRSGKSLQGEGWIREITRIIGECCSWPYWNRQLLFNSVPQDRRESRLIGSKRINAILTNVIIPFYAAECGLPPDTFEHIPPEDISSPMRTAAWYLLGRDHNPALYSGNNLLQQGLLQIYLDFCLPVKSGCNDCRLCKKLERELGGCKT
jgi:hypothetical protein